MVEEWWSLAFMNLNWRVSGIFHKPKKHSSESTRLSEIHQEIPLFVTPICCFYRYETSSWYCDNFVTDFVCFSCIFSLLGNGKLLSFPFDFSWWFPRQYGSTNRPSNVGRRKRQDGRGSLQQSPGVEIGTVFHIEERW